MISLQIADTDAFLDMPLSTQALYFHFIMRADDEGFIDNPKRITKLINAQDDDLKILIAKRFILTFNNGIVVIKHWLIHNTIRMDRFNKTVYLEEKNQLILKKNNAYTESKKIDSNNIKQIEEKNRPEWQVKRNEAYKKGSLPDSFSYKIRQAFEDTPCPICEVIMKGYKYSDNKKPTIQHNKPISKGGKHEINNISVICKECNVSIRNKETDKLNNESVVEVWNDINHSATARQHKLSKVKLSKVSIALQERKDIKFLKDDYNEIIEAYKTIKGIDLQGSEYQPLQQAIKTMFMNNRKKEDIISLMHALNNSELDHWQGWTINTVKNQIPLYLSGKLTL